MQKMEKIWMDGKMVDWDKAQVHVLTHTLHYGFGVFEGTRCYKCVDGSAIFRLDDHLKRLFNSAQILGIKIPYSIEDLKEASCEILRVNKMEEGYLRHIVFMGSGEMGLGSANPIRTVIAAWPWGAYLGAEALQNGIRLKTSSYVRLPISAFPAKAKAVGNYVNSILAKRDAVNAGYDEALMLDIDGYVAEGSGENIFILKDRILRTPPEGSSILNGITRNSLIRLAREAGYRVMEEKFPRDYVFTADEVFLTGTAAEVTPVREVDDRLIGAGKAGPVTIELQKAFFAVVKGENREYRDWLTYI